MINEARRYETTQKNKTFTLAFKTSNSVWSTNIYPILLPEAN